MAKRIKTQHNRGQTLLVSTDSTEGTEDPIEILMAEHEKSLRHLQHILSSAESIQANGFSAEAFQQIADSTRFIGTEVRRHSDNEEQYLFPLMDRHVFESPNAMRRERWEMWQAFNELSVSIKDIEDGRIHGNAVKEFIHSATRVVDLFKNHINKENTIFFPLVKRLLTPTEYEHLKRVIVDATSSSKSS